MREYFPMLLGNDAAKARLSTAILRNTLPHAFLFLGAFGSGKKTLAGELAKALNCERRDSASHPLPCGVCNNCRRISEGLFPDVHYILRETDKISIGVKTIEAMRSDIMLSATESDYRVYIIPEGEKLTQEAQNAMLTVLEEPPPNVVIIILAEEADKILTTIKSRVQTVAMSRFDENAMRAFLKEKSERARVMSAREPEMLSGIIAASDGRLGKALSMLEDGSASEDLKARRELVEELCSVLKPSTPFAELLAVIKKLPKGRVEFKETLEEMLLALRDLILIKYDRGAAMSFFIDPSHARALADKLAAKRLFALYDVFLSALDNNAKNANIGAQTANIAAQIKLI